MFVGGRFATSTASEVPRVPHGTFCAPNECIVLRTYVHVWLRFVDDSLTACTVEEISAGACPTAIEVDGPLQEISAKHCRHQFAVLALVRHEQPCCPSSTPSRPLWRIPQREVLPQIGGCIVLKSASLHQLCWARRPIAILIQDHQFEPVASVRLYDNPVFAILERILAVCPHSQKRAVTLGEVEGAAWPGPFRDFMRFP